MPLSINNQNINFNAFSPVMSEIKSTAPEIYVDIPTVTSSMQPGPQLTAPNRSFFSPLDFDTAQTKLASPILSGETLSPAREQKNTETINHALKSAGAEEGINKAQSYKTLAKSALGLMSSMTSTTFLIITTAATGGATAPLLVISNLVLANAIIDTVFATINVTRARKDLPPINIESFIQRGVSIVLRKLHIPETMVDKLSTNVFKHIGTTYSLALTVAQFALSFTIVATVPKVINLLSHIATGIFLSAKLGVIVLMPNKDESEEDKGLREVKEAIGDKAIQEAVAALKELSQKNRTAQLIAQHLGQGIHEENRMRAEIRQGVSFIELPPTEELLADPLKEETQEGFLQVNPGLVEAELDEELQFVDVTKVQQDTPEELQFLEVTQALEDSTEELQFVDVTQVLQDNTEKTFIDFQSILGELMEAMDIFTAAFDPPPPPSPFGGLQPWG